MFVIPLSNVASTLSPKLYPEPSYLLPLSPPYPNLNPNPRHNPISSPLRLTYSPSSIDLCFQLYNILFESMGTVSFQTRP